MKVYTYHSEDKVQLVLAEPRRTRVVICMVDGPVRLVSKPITETRYMIESDASVNAMRKSLRRRGRTFGITKGAKRFLRVSKSTNH